MPILRRLSGRRLHVVLSAGLALPLTAGAWVAGCTNDTASPPTTCAGAVCIDAAFVPDGALPTFDAQPDTTVADVAVDSSPPGADTSTDDATAASDAQDAAEAIDAADAGAADDASDSSVGLDAADAADAFDAADAADAADGGPTVLAAANSPYHMVLGGGFVYWDEIGGSQAIKRVSTTGGAVTPIAAGMAASMAIDANNVYWTTQVGDVFKCAHTSTTPVKLATGQYEPIGVATDGTYVYWVPYGTSATIYQVPIAGGADAGTLTPHTMDTPTAIAFAGGKTYVALRNASAGFGYGTIGILPGDGGVPVPIATGLDGPQQLITDGVRLYWTDDEGATPNGIQSLLLGGGGAITYTQYELHPQIATDGVNLYYTDYTSGFGGHVVRRPVGTVIGAQTLYSTSYPYQMGVDSTHVYWVDRIDNVVYRGDK